jgi:hypothetical protein
MLPSDGGGGIFLSPIPEPPGDPAALSAGAAAYTAAQGEIDRDHSTLVSAAAAVGGSQWQGAGAAGFAKATGDLAAVYALTATALAQGASALKAYSTALTAAKQAARQANAAVATANAAASAMLSAQSAAEQAQSAANDAEQTANTAQAHAAANPHSPAAATAADHARTSASDAATTASNAWSRVNMLTSAWQADRTRALALIAQAQADASRAATTAASGFNAAAGTLAGKKPQQAPGGATGVTDGNPWQTVVDELAMWNDRAGWALNSWGAFGAYVLTRAEVGYLEAAASFGTASAGYDDAIAAVLARTGGFFGPDGFYNAQDAFNAALKARAGAAGDLSEAIAPEAGSWGFMDVLGRAGLGLGMASDLVTELAPTPSFGPGGVLGGNTDRVMAGLNFAASGLALGSSLGIDAAIGTMAVIPGGQVVVGAVLIGTAAYFAGEFVYQHWGTIAHWGSDAWHGIESAGSWAGHELGGLGHDIGKAFSWL